MGQVSPRREAPGRRRLPLPLAILVGLLSAVWVAIVLLTPLVGAWVASSLAAYYGAPMALAAGMALLLFPVLPVVWELQSRPKRRPGQPAPRRLLSLRVRLFLRTLGVNGAWLALVLLWQPRGVFEALSVRGDWMLPASGGAQVEQARRALFQAAALLEWSWALATPDPYREHLAYRAPKPPPPAEPPRPVEPPKPAEPAEPPPPVPPEDEPLEDGLPEDDSDLLLWVRKKPPEPSDPIQGRDQLTWPYPLQVDERVVRLSSSYERDVSSLAQELVRGVRDPYLRIKALHDWVADRIEYDVEAYENRQIPAQDVQSVLERRKAVCAGYANVLAALGQAVGEEVVVISGKGTGPRGLESHAWNAVRIEGRWHLVDVTWNAGYVEGSRFVKRYTTAWLLTPPELFAESHLPDDPSWQLLERPVSAGDMLRRPRITPVVFEDRQGGQARTYESGVRVVEPSRERIEVRGAFEVELANPNQLRTSVVVSQQGGREESCAPTEAVNRFRCPVLERGLHEVRVFAGPEHERMLTQVSHFEVVGT